jgi:hypothetical protein
VLPRRPFAGDGPDQRRRRFTLPVSQLLFNLLAGGSERVPLTLRNMAGPDQPFSEVQYLPARPTASIGCLCALARTLTPHSYLILSRPRHAERRTIAPNANCLGLWFARACRPSLDSNRERQAMPLRPQPTSGSRARVLLGLAYLRVALGRPPRSTL